MQHSSAGLPPTWWHCFRPVTSFILACLYQKALCVPLASLCTGVPVKQKTSLSFDRLDLLTYLRVSVFVLEPGSEYFVLGAMATLVAPPTRSLYTPCSLFSSLIATCFLTSILTLSWLLTSVHSLCWQFPWSPALGHPRVLFFHLLRHGVSQSPALITGPSSFSGSLSPRGGRSRNFLSGVKWGVSLYGGSWFVMHFSVGCGLGLQGGLAILQKKRN